MTSETHKFKIAIAGGGLGGLALAGVIGKFGPELSVDVYEAGAAITTVGAGISLSRRAFAVMKHIGIDKEIEQKGLNSAEDLKKEKAADLTYRRADDPNGGQEFYQQPIPRAVTLHRKDLLAALAGAPPPTTKIHLNKRLEHYSVKEGATSDAITLHFADGTTATTDVLIGADGIKSPTRQTMYTLKVKKEGKDLSTVEPFLDPTWSGTVAYRFLIPAAKLREVDPNHRTLTTGINYLGKNRHVVAFPVSQGTIVNVGAFVANPDKENTPFPDKWVEDVTKDELQKVYHDFEPEVQTLLSLAATPSRWAIHVMRSLPFYADGRVAILGDAAHASTPYFGHGAGQAIEDAYILGRILAHPSATLENISQLFDVYEKIRLEVANDITQQARLVGQVYTFNSKESFNGTISPGKTLEQELQGVKAAIEDKWQWQMTDEGGPDEDWAKAEELIAEKVKTV